MCSDIRMWSYILSVRWSFISGCGLMSIKRNGLNDIRIRNDNSLNYSRDEINLKASLMISNSNIFDELSRVAIFS
jgi:hypothetical protein